MTETEIRNAWNDYFKLPLAYGCNKSEIYQKNWVKMEGRSFATPHPHRHYTLVEFAYKIGNDHIFRERFEEK